VTTFYTYPELTPVSKPLEVRCPKCSLSASVIMHKARNRTGNIRIANHPDAADFWLLSTVTQTAKHQPDRALTL